MNFQISSPHITPKSPYFESLAGVDWNFSCRRKASRLESIHPYPAKFIPEIPGSILDCLPLPKGTAVLDPFVGSGTTLVECQRRGITSIGIDLNPIACLISRVKTAPGGMAASVAEDVVFSAKKLRAVHIPTIPNLDHWFKRDIQNDIARLVASIDLQSIYYRDILRLALSSILVKVSNQESDTRYAAISKDIGSTDVYNLFLIAAKRISDALQERTYDLAPATVLEMSTLNARRSDIDLPIGAIITSPPYPNAYEYWLYHKYRMWWLGYDPLAVKEQEIGARAHFFKTNHHTSDDFVRQMSGTFDLISQTLVKGGYACFVVGRSKIHGNVIDNAAIIRSIAEQRGFNLVFNVERVISASRKSFNLSHANIKTETIVVLTRE